MNSNKSCLRFDRYGNTVQQKKFSINAHCTLSLRRVSQWAALFYLFGNQSQHNFHGGIEPALFSVDTKLGQLVLKFFPRHVAGYSHVVLKRFQSYLGVYGLHGRLDVKVALAISLINGSPNCHKYLPFKMYLTRKPIHGIIDLDKIFLSFGDKPLSDSQRGQRFISVLGVLPTI